MKDCEKVLSRQKMILLKTGKLSGPFVIYNYKCIHSDAVKERTQKRGGGDLSKLNFMGRDLLGG
jgi:hypothetical protein